MYKLLQPKGNIIFISVRHVPLPHAESTDTQRGKDDARK